ncbi:MAG: glycoside hydrolase family 2 protein [bacterium]|nr:beta-mannosidase [Deltaproteobacteria bacterium]MCP4907617.1 glycoside hydrolase family 2 protein [bacterium]
MTPLYLKPVRRRPLSEGWEIRRIDAEPCAHPSELTSRAVEGPLDACAATLPCTVASALRDAGQLDLDDAESVARLGDLDRLEHWFRCEFEIEDDEGGPAELVFHGLATLAEIWLNGECLLKTRNMFVRHVCEVTGRLEKRNELAIRFPALEPVLRKKRPRARWRSRLVAERNLRFVRTTLFGRMSSWCPPIPPVGPWGGVELVTCTPWAITLEQMRVRTELADGYGLVHLVGEISVPADLRVQALRAGLQLEIGDVRRPLECEPLGEGRFRVKGTGTLEDVEPWWPHTQLAEGTRPRLYPMALCLPGADSEARIELDPIGFRTIERTDRHGFGLTINGESLFCRGACWAPIDALALRARPEALRSALERACDAGMNMLRVTGTVVYEEDAFYRLCDELGLLVWQDFMFSALDYPTDDEDFFESVVEEVDQFLDRTQGRACLAVLCGNSEGQQQPAMLGLGSESWQSAFFDEWLPARCADRRPDLPYWTSTPSGGELPFHTREGTSHYFGVGAYQRPLSDALLAQPSFMTECLAFSNLPGVHGLDSTPRSRVPRDSFAEWDFADVLGHYRNGLFGEGSARGDGVLEAALCRATSASLMQTVQTLWRDPASGCGGSLVLMQRDPWRCAGWGVFDARGEPKSALFGLRRAWAPLAVALLDDGLNGLRVLIFNDSPTPVSAELVLQLMRTDGVTVESATIPISIAANTSFGRSVDAVLEGFIDSSYAYRFGPRGFDLCVARLLVGGAESASVLEAIHLPFELGLLPPTAIGLSLGWSVDGAGEPVLELSSDRFAQMVSIDLEGGEVEDNFFHLAPRSTRRVRVRRVAKGSCPTGTVRALNGEEEVAIPDFGSLLARDEIGWVES